MWLCVCVKLKTEHATVDPLGLFMNHVYLQLIRGEPIEKYERNERKCFDDLSDQDLELKRLLPTLSFFIVNFY